MATITLLPKLCEKLRAQEARWISTSLYGDPLVWASLQAYELSEEGNDLEPGCYKKWNPAYLALHTLECSLSAEELAGDLSKSPDINLLQMSLKYFQETRRSMRPPKSISEA